MLLIVDKSLIDGFRDVENTKIYNINTLHEGFIDASILFSIINTREFLSLNGGKLNNIITIKDESIYSFIEEDSIYNEDFVKNFDTLYKDIIFGNDKYFTSFFSIIFDLYYNTNVVLVVDFSRKNSEFIMESLTKLIQQVYEYDSIYIYKEEDIEGIKDNKAEFGITGLYNLGIDMNRYVLLTGRMEDQVDHDTDEFLI